MAKTIRSFRIIPSEAFVAEWEEMLVYYRQKQNPHIFLEDVFKQYTDRIDRSISARQAIAIDRIASNLYGRKRLYKDTTYWEKHPRKFNINYNSRETSGDPVLVPLKAEDTDNIHWLNAMEG